MAAAIQVAAQLRALDPGAPKVLPTPAAEIVRRFYGLVDGTPWTQRAIADALGLPRCDAQRNLTSPAVSRLLGEPGHRPDRQRVVVACAICGTAVERSPRQTRDRVQTTCSPGCRLEWQRGQAARLTSEASRRARRVEHLRQQAASPEFRERMRQVALRRARPHADAVQRCSPKGLAALPGRERDLVRQDYGLDGEPRSLAELAGTPATRQDAGAPVHRSDRGAAPGNADPAQ